MEKINPILEQFLIDVDSLVLDPENLNKHPRRNIDAIKRSLSEWGQQKPHIVYDPSTMVVSTGNGVLIAARELGWKKVAAIPTDIKDGLARKLFAIADNQIPRTSVFDYEGMTDLFRGVDLSSIDLTITGFADFELEPLLNAEWSHESVAAGASVKSTDVRGSDVVMLQTTTEIVERAKEVIKHATNDGLLEKGVDLVCGLVCLAEKTWS